MDRIDDTEHFEQAGAADPASLLVVILDTNPYAWSKLASVLPLKTALSHLLLFLNTHLAFSHANDVAVIASHTKSASYLYPSAHAPPAAASAHDANKYRKFRQVEETVQASLRALLLGTDAADIAGTNDTLISGALSLALAYIHRATAAGDDGSQNLTRPGEEAGAGEVGRVDARILVVSVSGDLGNQYVSVMNSIFAAQRQKVPIDVCKLAGDTVFLQQASEATDGIYMQLETPGALLQYLLTCFVPDNATRKHMVSPSQINVDFRAACFCHKRVVDVGFVCSICLSKAGTERERLPHREKKQRGKEVEYDEQEEGSAHSWENSVQGRLDAGSHAMVKWWLSTLPRVDKMEGSNG